MRPEDLHTGVSAKTTWSPEERGREGRNKGQGKGQGNLEGYHKHYAHAVQYRAVSCRSSKLPAALITAEGDLPLDLAVRQGLFGAEIRMLVCFVTTSTS